MAASYGAPTSFQSRTASDNVCSAPAVSPSARRTLPRATAALATSALLSNRVAMTSSSSAAERARRCRRLRSRSRPAPRAAARAASRCSVGAPWKAPARGDRGRLVRTQPRRPRRLSPTAPAPGPVGDPTRRDERRGMLPPRPPRLLCGVGSGRARSTATPARPHVGAQLVAGHERLTLGLVARAAQPQDLGAVDPATAVKAPDRVGLAPPLHRLGPLLGHVVLGETLQGAHELAYTTPVESASSSPETVATPASSSSANPCWTSPSMMSNRASATRPMAHAAGSHVDPTSMARRAHCRALGMSPVSIRS